MPAKNVAAAVLRAVEEPIRNAGYDLWDLEYVKEGSEWYLRITIDSARGVDIDDCEKVFRLVDPIITDLDPIENAYHLEVSSPGLERVLRTAEHYKACVGKEIAVKLFTPVNGRKEWKGKLSGVLDDASICLETETGPLVIEQKRISRANVSFDYASVDFSDADEEETEEDPDDGSD